MCLHYLDDYTCCLSHSCNVSAQSQWSSLWIKITAGYGLKNRNSSEQTVGKVDQYLHRWFPWPLKNCYSDTHTSFAERYQYVMCLVKQLYFNINVNLQKYEVTLSYFLLFCQWLTVKGWLLYPSYCSMVAYSMIIITLLSDFFVDLKSKHNQKYIKAYKSSLNIKRHQACQWIFYGACTKRYIV